MGSASSAITWPSTAAAKPPRRAISRFTATAMSASLQPMTQTLWLSWPIDEAMAPRVMPKPLTKPCPTLPWSLCRPRTATFRTSRCDVGHQAPSRIAHVDRQPVGQDLARAGCRSPATDRAAPAGTWKVAAVTGRSFTESSPTSGTSGRALKRSGVTGAPRQITDWTAAGLEILQQHDVGALARRHQAAIEQAEMAGRRPGGGAIGVERPHAAADGGADQVVDMALLGDVERVAVVGAEAPGTARARW